MSPNLKIDEWRIIETLFVPELNRASESIFSIGNGHMGQRANFEEKYSGDSLQGNYIAGVYYPDKTRVGWWKIGYPDYFAKVLNSPNWIGIDINIDGEDLDLAKCRIESFTRILDLKEGTLERLFTVEMITGTRLEVNTKRFVSLADHEVGVIKYSVKLLNSDASIRFTPYIDGDVTNEDSNYDEKFWEEVIREVDQRKALIITVTKKNRFYLAVAMDYLFYCNGTRIDTANTISEREKYVARVFEIDARQGQEYTIHKFAAVLSSENHQVDSIGEKAIIKVQAILNKDFDNLLEEHRVRWINKWDESDVKIEGDPAAQQGIRFNIFQLNQTYCGDDERLNIGPKGFTGEKYGGSTYWDTEAFALPFYLRTAGPDVGKNLLLYRYRHLGKAIENAEKLGFNGGAALFPMVTMNGEECHNEWEITFEEIHRNGAIAYAIYNYINHTGDKNYLEDYGLEVLIAISRFWSQRVNYSISKNKYVILGVTGPNEYENNVNNNWYTNKISVWTLNYTIESIENVKSIAPEKYQKLKGLIRFDEESEIPRWKDIIKNMFFPVNSELGIILQQEGYLDKDQLLASDIPEDERPINQHWSWDRILRSTFIKQADVLQGLYMFSDEFEIETLKKNFEFYEPRTVHESSLSPCIYSIIACKINKLELAYKLFLRTARLDLDDYNKEVKEGLHITSMAGTWLSMVEGFGGMKIKNNRLHFNPQIPEAWKNYSFKMRFRNNLVKVYVSKGKVSVANLSAENIPLDIYGTESLVEAGKTADFTY